MHFKAAQYTYSNFLSSFCYRSSCNAILNSNFRLNLFLLLMHSLILFHIFLICSQFFLLFLSVLIVEFIVIFFRRATNWQKRPYFRSLIHTPVHTYTTYTIWIIISCTFWISLLWYWKTMQYFRNKCKKHACQIMHYYIEYIVLYFSMVFSSIQSTLYTRFQNFCNLSKVVPVCHRLPGLTAIYSLLSCFCSIIHCMW